MGSTCGLLKRANDPDPSGKSHDRPYLSSALDFALGGTGEAT
jgi:hypothetical protein